MCGIAGIISRNGVEIGEVQRMTQVIQHRGPDGEGHWINKTGNVALGHRRLSIIDLSNAGSQPMFTEDNRYGIIFNGEIYNYLELKQSLVKKGYHFHSNSDTEVLLNLYADKGIDCLSELDGMFAFCIWDEFEKKLFCARDRFGEKPFYYHYVPGRHFVFASEIKAIKAYGIPLEFHPHRIAWYFNDKYALSNIDEQDETFYKNIYKLEAGFCLTVDKDLHLLKSKYWDINLDAVNLSITLEEAKEQFSYLFHQSVGRRLRSDVPVGTSLSGGLDSSSVVCVIAELLRNAGATQKTFSARFKNYEKDEGVFIEEVIKGKQLQAYYTWPEADDLFTEFEQFMYHQEEPVGSANQFSQWEVMKLAKKENVTVLLDGQGADEVITGYQHYFDIYFRELNSLYPKSFLAELEAYKQNINPKYELVLQHENEKQTLAAKAKGFVYPVYSNVLKPFRAKQKNGNGLLNADYTRIVMKHKAYRYIDFNKGLNNALYYDAKEGKMEVLLRYGDKNSMAHSREVRLPFLSHELAEFVFSLPPWFKIHNGWSKFILREAMQNILPEKIAWRKDKIGYETPQDKWLIKTRFQEMMHESIKILEDANILNPQKSDTQTLNREWQILNIAGLIKQFSI